MSSKFITNKDCSLSQTVKNTASKSVRFDFLVGYFFLSGFSEIKDELLDKNLRILIGMDVDISADHCIQEYFKDLNGKRNPDSNLTIRTKYQEDLVKAINEADRFDSKEGIDTFKLFKGKILDGTLQIRKTREPNHAKMYLFYASEDNPVHAQEPGKVIVGSSNFSYQGLTGRNEVNVYLQDSNDFEDAVKIFEEFWDNAVDLIVNKEEFVNQILEHTWLEKIPSPYLMYLRVLDEYFKIGENYIKTPSQITHDGLNQFFDVSYQTEAIREGLQKIKRHSGVIIADVVGLGKSVIASTIAANLDLPTVIICPPHLESQWQDYAQNFGLRGYAVFTPGKIEDAVNKYNGRSDMVVIIDEAHRYRNEATQAYGMLHRLCAGNKVILLSATPFNNRPEDIFSMVKLFQIPANSTIQSVNNLGDQMEKLSIDYKKLKDENRNSRMDDKSFETKSKKIASEIKEILDPIIIRRTRIDLEKVNAYRDDLKSQGIEFSKINPPKELEYSLGNISNLYMDTLALLTGEKEGKGFIGARYKPLTYLKKDDKIRTHYATEFDIENFETGQRNMAKFMQQLFVRRFESSKYSFVKTVQNVLNSMNNLKNVYEKYKIVPLYKKGKMPDFDVLDEDTDDPESKLFPSDEIMKSQFSKEIEKGLILVKAEDLNQNFIADLKSDITLFEKFLNDWENVESDPKFDCTLHEIRNSLKREKDRKIIVFSEFSDTADYLYGKIKDAGLKVMMYSSKTATKSAREQIRASFDAGYPENLRANGDLDFDILVATDAISEGFSLHRAGTIYNYDIPYNPTRVIQRVGRINRINKKVFDELFIYNFFPTPTGEMVSHTQEISTFKMKLFQAILGSDTKILKDDETTEGYMQKKFIAAENDENSESWETPYKNELNDVKTNNPELLEQARALPFRCRIARKDVRIKTTDDSSLPVELFEEKCGVLLFSKKGDSYRFNFATELGKSFVLSAQEAIKLFKCEKEEQSFSVSEKFYAMYQRAKEESGVIKVSKAKSKILQEANKALLYIQKKYSSDKNKTEYIKGVTEIANKETFPDYYLKQIKKIDLKENDIFEQLQTIIPEEYLDSLIEKDNKVGSEPETILLAEELSDCEENKK